MVTAATTNKFVIAADDDAFCQQILKTLLTALKAEHVIVGDGEAAVSEYKKRNGEVGLVLLDIHMPKKDGYQAAQEISQLGTTRIVGLSADNDATTQSNAKKAGMESLVTKPIKKAELAKLLV
eukprot:CAMPEP_0176425848 /NCGR_PEP_ID=MMETSP0127-20121128/11613_1 /TAXON_ID=938130 /ORGANISM="Platyophrya macrostoma, Strain WH" /LENGTH=122 /DNA_ID=CAMNT_0017807047 /DNA_START=23 /DNA_END=391 /DNA_ORIENTATION=+